MPYLPENSFDVNGHTIPYTSSDLIIRCSKAGGLLITYVGYARPGITEDLPAWEITKFTYDATGDVIASGKAGGRNTFTNIWDSGRKLTITDVTAALEGVVTVTEDISGYADYTEFEIYDVTGMVELNGKFWQLEAIDEHTFYLCDQDSNRVDTSGFTGYTADGECGVYEYLNHIYS